MTQYGEGDIVLLSHSKLGIMTSSTTVREIHGDDTEISRIVKKLSAKELAESLVDLMERYNNLENKSSHSLLPPSPNKLSSSSPSSQSIISENNNNINNNLSAPKPSKHEYKISATMDTTTNTTNTHTTSGTKDTNISNTTSTSTEPKPKSLGGGGVNSNKCELEIPKTPNYGNHVMSPSTDSNNRYNHYSYGGGHGLYTNKLSTNDESATNTTTTATSTISSLSPSIKRDVIYNNNNNNNTNHRLNINNKRTKSPKPKKKLFAKITKIKKNKKNKPQHNPSSNNHHIYSSKLRSTTSDITKPSTKSKFLFGNKTKKTKLSKLSKTTSASETNLHHNIPPAIIDNYTYNSYQPQIHHTSHGIHPYHQHPSYISYPPSYNEHNPLPFSHVRSSPDDIIHHQQHEDNNTHLLHPHHHDQYTPNTVPKTRYSRSKSTDTHPYQQQDTHHQHNIHNNIHMNRYQHNPYYIAYTPSHNTHNSTITPPIPSPHPPHHAHYFYNQQGQSSTNPIHPTWHQQQLSAVSPSGYSSTAPIPMQYNIPSHPPYHVYNKYATHPLSRSNPNPSPPNNDDDIDDMDSDDIDSRTNTNTLIDVLLSAPDNRKNINMNTNIHHKKDENHTQKKKSHPYKKRTIKKLATNDHHTKKLHGSVATIMTSKTNLTQSPSASGTSTINTNNIINNNGGIPPTYPQQYVPLNLLKSPEPQNIIDPIMTDGTGRYYHHSFNNNNSREHNKNTSNTMDSKTTINSDPLREYHNNYYNENSYTNNNNHKKGTTEINNHYIYSNDSLFDSYNGISPRQSRRNSPKYHSYSNHHHHHRGGSHSPHNSSYHHPQRKNYQSPRGQRYGKRPFSAHQNNNKINNYKAFDFGAYNNNNKSLKQRNNNNRNNNKRKTSSSKHNQSNSNTKSSVTLFSEIEGKNEYSSQNKTIKPFYPSHPNEHNANNNNKPKLTTNNAYSSPVFNQHHNDYLIHPKHMKGYKARDDGGGHWRHSKTMGNNIDINTINMEDDTWNITSDFYGNNVEKSMTETMIIHNKDDNDIQSPYQEGRKSHSYSILGNMVPNTVNSNGIAVSMDDMMTPLTLSPEPLRNKHRRQKRSQSVVGFFDPKEPSHLGDSLNIKQNALDDLDIINRSNNNHDEDEEDVEIMDDREYNELTQKQRNIMNKNDNNNNNKKKKNNNDSPSERHRNYKIVLRTENSNKAYYIQDNIKNSDNHLVEKPRFSQSTSKSTATAQSASFTPTISQTPSYLREEGRWQKSMTGGISQTGTRSTNSSTEEDDEWMLHNQININGITDDSQSIKHRFFGNDPSEFPNIHSISSHSNDTVKVHKYNKMKPQIPPKLSHHDIATEHELQKSIRLKKKYKNKTIISPTSTTAASDTNNDDISKSSFITGYMQQ